MINKEGYQEKQNLSVFCEKRWKMGKHGNHCGGHLTIWPVIFHGGGIQRHFAKRGKLFDPRF